MRQRKYPAVFMRGGTSRAIFFHEKDLPKASAERDAVFLKVLGSPDPNGRQLDGLGGGVSSLSKVAVVAPSSRADADVDFTFAQVGVREKIVDYAGTCGNISSAVGPFAVDEGLTAPTEENGDAVVRVHNTNTGKIYHARFPVEDGAAAVDGSCELPGVPGSGARITLEFMDPGGAVTGELLPSGGAVDVFRIEGLGDMEVSMVDATNPMAFVRAKDVGLTGGEAPGLINGRVGLMVNLEQIRAEAAVRMGMAGSRREASESVRAVPKVALVAPPVEYMDLKGEVVPANACDLVSRVVSMGKTHRAYALTGAMCLAVAARIPGTLVHEAAREVEGDIRLGHPSGVQRVNAGVSGTPRGYRAEKVVVYRTARRLMEGLACVPAT